MLPFGLMMVLERSGVIQGAQKNTSLSVSY